jgi:arylsulfatase A-like enzyme
MTTFTRRAFLGQTAAAATLAQNRERPVNLIYVFADQLRRFSCGYAGDEFAHTPNIDRLARESLDVRNAASSTPVCAPYRATLMTGKYQSSTGMVINELRLSPEHECLGHVLSKGGYDTAYIGKWHLWANQLGHHDETINGFVPPGPYRLGFDQYWAAYNFNHT